MLSTEAFYALPRTAFLDLYKEQLILHTDLNHKGGEMKSRTKIFFAVFVCGIASLPKERIY